jgi:hypothetical protein
MRILLDHNTPPPLRFALQGHQVETAYERGWAELLNGDLIEQAEASGFELLITTDRAMRYQQNWTGRKISLLVLSTNDWTRLRVYKGADSGSGQLHAAFCFQRSGNPTARLGATSALAQYYSAFERRGVMWTSSVSLYSAEHGAAQRARAVGERLFLDP